MNADMNTRSNLVGENEVRHLQILSFRTEKQTCTWILVFTESCIVRQLYRLLSSNSNFTYS